MWVSSSGAARVLAGAFRAFVARFALPAFAARAFDLRDVFAIGLLLAVLGVTPQRVQVIHQPETDCKTQAGDRFSRRRPRPAWRVRAARPGHRVGC
jgi:hypothetical protein